MAATEDHLIVVAVILGAHGVRGDVRVKSFTELPEDALGFGPLMSADGAPLLTPRRARPVKDHFIVTPEEARQKETWDSLKGTLLHVHRSCLPAVDEDEFYIDDLTGCHVVDAAGLPIGRIKSVHNFGAGDLIEIAPVSGGKSVMVPFTEVDVPDVDLAAGRVTVATFGIWSDERGKPGEA
ncbi:MAG: ribosome maturation factor RimM [Pseudomonadota bacterium]